MTVNDARWVYSRPAWRVFAWFAPLFFLLNVAWEIAQLPFYSLWREGSAGEIAVAVLHCSVGDVLIGTSALMLALVCTRSREPATWNRVNLIAIITAFGVGYTVFSEWINIRWLGNWSYSPLMPTFPLLETGLAPLLQWLVLPGAGFRLAMRVAGR